MSNQFFEQPILNPPSAYPSRHWVSDETGQPTQQIREMRRPASFIAPVPKPRKQKGAPLQQALVFDEGKGVSTEEQQYEHEFGMGGAHPAVTAGPGEARQET